jgi:hypothetical protein
MNRGALILAGAMVVVTGGVIWASNVGFGVPQPSKQPVSIREGSQRPARAGVYRTHYFVGGGIHRGK